MNLGRVWVIAVNVFREVIRDRILYLLGVFAIALVAIAALLPEVAAGTELKILLDVGLAAIGLTGLVIAIFVGTGLVNKEIEKRTVYVLIAKPVSKAEFILGKHLGLSAVLAVLVAAMTLIFVTVVSFYRAPFPLASLLIAALFQFLELSLMVAVAILFGVFTSSLLAIALTVGIYLMGHFSRDLVSLGNLSQNPVMERITQGLYLLLPDLARLNLKNQAVYGLAALPPASELWANAAYGVLYTALLLAIATVIFSRRQF
ncbi:ABC transporter permease subunit [Thermoleptolyngbya sp. C42_A2020_037]|uniref:ABC transporter permease n=1 Tax=Thermoleptolyngbya sp. C42_A2020_037 TaxID=2747799 RepID=UPI0019E92B87|nr:ABC transporter permease subunit [Thermoleptolyngbya sp. C42_A2020_037]MBF2086178.1 ABC transporter permease subunit [Thermoleptolyngbya sp. C42_A2020_037]